MSDFKGGWELVDGHLTRNGDRLTLDEMEWAVGRLNGVPHGEYRYRKGCRCDVCRAAAYEHGRKRSQRAQAESPRTRAGLEWTGPEIEIIERDDLTTRQMAQMLGRSFYAVEHARSRLKTRYAYMAGRRR